MKLRSGITSSSKQLQSIELLRGLAALMVCYFHIVGGKLPNLPQQNFITKSASWGWSGVEVFFIISGFIIPFSMFQKKYRVKNFFTFFKKRIVRIEPPYLFSVALIVLLNLYNSWEHIHMKAFIQMDWWNILGHIIYLDAYTGGKWLNVVYWTLAIELQYYLFMALVFSLVISDKIYQRITFFVLFAVSSFIHIPNGSYLFSFSGFFLAGILLFQFVCNIISKKEFLILILSLFIFLFYQSGAYLAFLTLGTLLAIYFIKTVPVIFRQLGIISYSLYLIHLPIGGGFMSFINKRTSNIFIRECAIFIAIGISIMSATIFYRLIEKKFKLLSSSIKYSNAKNQQITY